MKKNLLSLIFIFVILQFSFSQEKRTQLKGIIYNTVSHPIENTHIVNLTTKQGTISDKNGVFNLALKSGDWIQISNIQFRTKKIKLKKGTIQEGFLSVYLIPVTNLLEEAVLQKKMKGDLVSDMLMNKKDTIREKMNSILAYIKRIPHEEIMKMKIGADERHLIKPRNAQLTTDPVAKVAGLPPETIGIPDYYLLAKRALKKELNFKEDFPNKLIKLFGSQFFYVKLKIPKDKYYHFLQYCSPLGIEQLYKDQKYMELLTLFLKEGALYLKLVEVNQE